MFLWHGGKFPLCRVANHWFCLKGVGPGPVLCCLLLLPEAKRKSGWGICGSSAALSFCSVFLVCFTDLPSLFYRGTTAFHCEIFNSFDKFTPILGPSLRATSAVPEGKKNCDDSAGRGGCGGCITITHRGALQAVKIWIIQWGLTRSNAFERSRERTAHGSIWSSVAWTDWTAPCGSRNKLRTVWDGCSSGTIFRVSTMAIPRYYRQWLFQT